MIAKSYNIDEVARLVPQIYNTIRDYEKGLTVKAIAAKYNISDATVSKILHDNNIPLRFKNTKEVRVAEKEIKQTERECLDGIFALIDTEEAKSEIKSGD